MEYTIKKLAQLANISTRTLRYYDSIELLSPAKKNNSGYRVYGENEVNKLQQILFYKELGFKLSTIKKIIENPDFNRLEALKTHKYKLLEKRNTLDLLIQNINKTINSISGGVKMSDKEKFEGFKKEYIINNEKQYGKEIREKYGEEAVENSYLKFKKLSAEDYKKLKTIEEKLFKTLLKAMDENDPANSTAQTCAKLHKEWLLFFWDFYTEEAHAQLAQMYVDDERFTKYYDKVKPGAAIFLRDAIHIYTKKRQ